MILHELLAILDAIAPPEFAEPWDNVGLLIGDPSQAISHGLLCIDYTAEVAAEATAAGADFVFAYHPPLFKPIKRLIAGGPAGLLLNAAARGIALYSPHTALDVAAGGTNDVLAAAVGLTHTRPLVPGKSPADGIKLVTFVPADAVDRVASALFAAGAGRIGNYTACSFRSAGQGTFFGEAGTSPAIGEAGKLETVEEIRLETVVDSHLLPAIVAALKTSHPYETPAFDLVRLAPAPSGSGIGRIGAWTTPIAVAALVEQIKAALGISHVLLAGPTDRVAAVGAVCAGSCGEHLDLAVAAGCDVYVTGEMKHHDALRAAAAGLTVICTLHSHSERLTLASVARTLRERAPTVRWTLSAADRDPFQIR